MLNPAENFAPDRSRPVKLQSPMKFKNRKLDSAYLTLWFYAFLIFAAVYWLFDPTGFDD